MNIPILVVATIPLLAFMLFALDKFLSKIGAWRIPEALLLWIALLGGAAGALAAMKIFRHKTCKKRFTIGIPMMLLLHFSVMVLLLYLEAIGV